jgi:hypothetical protein
MFRSLRGIFGLVTIIVVACSGCGSTTGEPPKSYSKNSEPPKKVGGQLKGSNRPVRGFTVKQN